MSTKKLDEIRLLRNAANTIATFWETWRTKYAPDSHCDKKAATFVSPNERFAAFSFTLTLDAHAGYYGNSSSSRIFSVDTGLARKYFSQAIQKHAKLIFDTAAQCMLEDASKMTAEAEKEIAALQAMLDSVRQPEPPQDLAA